MRKVYGVALLCSVLFVGCGESTAKEVKSEAVAQVKTEVDEVHKKVSHSTEAMIEKAKDKVEDVKKDIDKATKDVDSVNKKSEPTKSEIPSPAVSKFYTIFKDSAKISTDGKEMLLLFGQDSDPYTQKIKDDIIGDEALAKKIKEAVTPVYIDARGQKRHKFQHNGEMMDVDTKTLVSIYNVTATPTLIFADSEASHIFVVPGYMPPKQFLVTLDFVEKKLWKGKDRKNGEVYETLRKFYEENGVEIKAVKK